MQGENRRLSEQTGSRQLLSPLLYVLTHSVGYHDSLQLVLKFQALSIHTGTRMPWKT